MKVILGTNNFKQGPFFVDIQDYSTVILTAVCGRHTDMVLELLSIIETRSFYLNDDIEKLEITLETYFQAAETGNSELLLRLLDTGEFEGDATIFYWPRSALGCAALGGHSQVVELLARGFTPDHEDFKNSPHWAANNGHEDVAAILLRVGADINHQARSLAGDLLDYSTPLTIAAVNNHSHMLQFLLDNGTSPRYDALLEAGVRGHNLIIQKLIKSGLDPNYNSIDRDISAFDAAVYSGQHQVVQTMLRMGAKYPDETQDIMNSLMFKLQISM